jgi:hypothetical protein
MVFFFLLKWREKVACLSDKELSKFLRDKMLCGSLKTGTGILFVQFRALNCVMESGSFILCNLDARCAASISLFLVSFSIVRMIT